MEKILSIKLLKSSYALWNVLLALSFVKYSALRYHLIATNADLNLEFNQSGVYLVSLFLGKLCLGSHECSFDLVI